MRTKTNRLNNIVILGALGVIGAASIFPAATAQSGLKTQPAGITSRPSQLHEVETGERDLRAEAIRQVLGMQNRAGGPSVSHQSGATERFAQTRQVVSAEGIVKWFSEAKGFGFITSDRGEDVYVPNSAVYALGLRTLRVGTRLSFEISGPPRSRLAKNLVLINE
jgi:CspA family cold shock protein